MNKAESEIKRLSIQSFARKTRQIMLTTISILLACVLILVCVLLAYSPGKPEPLLDENGKALAGSISEKVFVDINGVEQGMFIKGKDINNPVLLFVHGGPGMPEYWLTQFYPTSLEDHFTVVWWDQRGAGLSYSADIPPETMTAEQFISDTLEVTKYLRKRFGKEKIYLMAHSWGSYIGIQAAAREPELYTPTLAWDRFHIRSDLNNLLMNMHLSSTGRTETQKWFKDLNQRHPR